MPNLRQQLEALLFAAARPLTVAKLAELTDQSNADVIRALEELKADLRERGLHLVSNGRQWELGTASECASVVRAFVKAESEGELTRPQLETLAIIAYRGPVTKTEIEAIRGVHCGLILRNLSMRGLVEEEEDAKLGISKWRVSQDFLRHLGLTNPSDLADYEELHDHEVINRLLESNRAEFSVS